MVKKKFWISAYPPQLELLTRPLLPQAKATFLSQSLRLTSKNCRQLQHSTYLRQNELLHGLVPQPVHLHPTAWWAKASAEESLLRTQKTNKQTNHSLKVL